MKRLLLVRHAPTTATRERAFPADESLDDESCAAAAQLAVKLPGDCVALSSPARRAIQTAHATGLEPATEPRLAECDFGTWSGRRLEDIDRESPAATREWMTDPAAAPHGGESLCTFTQRVGAWLDEEATRERSVVAFTHGGVIRAAVAHVLGAGVNAVWRISVEPLSLTELHAVDGEWSLVALNRMAI
ncbi:MAG: histidine phosphatase family protein [Actinomycetota bacterium]|nr:histidine phosphatase family protein [Actinomycetota bacterium]